MARVIDPFSPGPRESPGGDLAGPADRVGLRIGEAARLDDFAYRVDDGDWTPAMADVDDDLPGTVAAGGIVGALPGIDLRNAGAAA